jgi:hypothetical protein
MTEYDFSPEAYQRHTANMQRISRWVDHTERCRFQFTNGAAFTTPDAVVDYRMGESSTRRIPPSAQRDQRMPFYPPNPPLPSQNFSYATTPGSPGPMPTLTYQHQPISPAPSHGHGTMSAFSPLSYDSMIQPQSPGFSHGHGTPISPPPFTHHPVIPPGYVIVSSGKSNTRKKSSSKRRSYKSAPLVYYHL